MYHPQSLFLLALSILVFPSQTQSYTKNKFLDCATTSIHCQDRDWNISYPFRRPSMPPYCGHPMFDVECINSDSILSIKISGNHYRVSNMNYDKQFIGVSNLDYIDYINDTCPHALYNTTIDISLFKYSVNDLNITMFLNCTPLALPSASLNISCPSSEPSANKSYYQVEGYGSPPPLDLFGNCNSVVVIPMYKDAASFLVGGRMDLLGVLQDGFGLNWVVDNGRCNDCEESGGICGNDPDSRNGWACFCSDGSATYGTCPGKSHKMYIAIGASVSAAFLIAFCVILLWHIRGKKHQKPGLSNLLSRSFSSNTSFKREAELGESNYHTHIFSYDELDAATDGFNASRELGDGGFGTVYKGKLRDGRTVAVKRLYEHNYRRLEQFMNEVEILSCLRHQYLVTLYGCTSRHSRELLLVYEYIPNGTVADHLHGPLASKGALPWSTRLSIAIETADALAYLHNVEPQVIHRDVKSNNILLDNNFHVKVADFGLSRLFPLDATHVSTAPQGTPGYVDPEYHQCYQLTDKSDVYSFGVVLVELISSKPAVDINRHRHEINLANLAVAKIQNCQVEELVDLDIGYMEDADIKRMINQVAELAFRCLQLDREMRPCITEVLEGLRGIEGKEAVEVVVVNEVKTKEEGRLLKSDLPCSPDSVTERWQSISTTPSASA